MTAPPERVVIAPPERVVIAGGGLAAVRTAQALRELGHDGRLVLVSEEPRTPYDRPPLSKAHLMGEQHPDPVDLLSESDAADLDLEVRLGDRVQRLDPAARTLGLKSAEELAFDALVVATGTRARRLPVLDGMRRIHYLRTAEDARNLDETLRSAGVIAIVGAGFIGLEVAAAARARGCKVTVIEVADKPLAPVLGDELASWLLQWHESQGTTFLCGEAVTDAQEVGARIQVVLGKGRLLEADAVVVGVGVARDLDWLAQAGLTTHVGLAVDEVGRTNLPAIFGAGDVVCRHAGALCEPILHWTAAADSARTAARGVLGLGPEPEVSDEYFWSNQGALRLMAVGRRSSDASLVVESGTLESNKFVAQWVVGSRIVGVVSANSPRDFLRSRIAYREGLESARLNQAAITSG